ncbi:hypothetical protein TD95_003752 [Thielaviopsis punctulata]|uniref:Mitochondrial import inner membrane translocase subunit Tim21 n=1 Tax=Thielaviopsis punctulata TaxID=72032 RepID=A0A0F4ZHZ8_9PEZI|nr:hypothetical protein TD95_003752 [Thielaviopsis punctulata]
MSCSAIGLVPNSHRALVVSSLLRPALISARFYATHHSAPSSSQSPASAPASSAPAQPRRRRVTAFNDDGLVPWAQLSAREKTSRATQQTFNIGLVAVGVVLTGVLVYTLFDEVFSPESRVAQFSRAVSFVKKDARCTAILGDASNIWAHGEETTNKWQRSRPVASTIEKDHHGVEHLVMQFYVEGDKAMGTVHLHMTRQPDSDDFEYKHLYLDVKGHSRIYIKRDETKPRAKKPFKFLGISWG